MINIAICQTKILNKKNNNLKKAKLFIEKSKEKKSKIIVLPEMFSCPYTDIFYKKNEYAEYANGETFKFLKNMSQNCILIGGSIIEKDKKGFYYNTSYIFENKQLIGKYRKINLFNINIKNININESNYFTNGNIPTVVKTSIGKIGILICFDIRFPELFLKIKKKENPFLYIIPTNFNTITGEAHLKLLARSRAVDFQSFIAIACSAGTKSYKYNSYGHSMLVNPWGNVINELETNEDILFGKINLKEIDLIRKKIILKY